MSDVINDDEFSDDVFCFGSTNESLNTFTGIVAGLSVKLWNETEEHTTHFHPTDCSDLVSEDSALLLDTEWEVQGDASLLDYDSGVLCEEAFIPITIMKFVGHKPHLDICKSINGRFMTEGEVAGDLFHGISNATNSCAPFNENLFWIAGEMLGSGLQKRCPTVHVNGTVGSQPCISELHCSICLLPKQMSFALYGEIFDLDRTFTLVGLNNGEFYLKGKEASEIHHNGSHWVMSSHLHSNQWSLQNSVFPSGRKIWQSEEKNLTLAVTQCNKGQFACNTGDCIKRKHLCDGYENCEEGEDEKECDIIRLNKGYDRNKSPGFGQPKQELLYYSLSIYSISDILTTDGQVTIDFLIYFTWYEYRMQYWNLKPQTQNFPCDIVWNPIVTAMAGYDDGLAFDLDTYDKKCGIYEDHPPKELAVNDPWMGK